MRSLAVVVTLVVVLAATAGQAFDPAGVDIIGLRLGMPEAEIVTTLQRQGFAVAHDHGALTARTRDGQLSIDLSEAQAVRLIRYTFSGNGVGEALKIRTSVLDRFGRPDQADPMVWCRAVGRNGVCPEDQASLTFLPATLTLVLRAGLPRTQ